jgi:poly(3-hydroxybutyrate) depolymerase
MANPAAVGTRACAKNLIPCLLLTAIISCAPASLPAQEMDRSSGELIFKVSTSQKNVRVFYFKPPGFKKSSQIVFVMHGVNRDAQRYRDEWIPHAKQHRFLLLAPEFSKSEFPGSAQYNLGNMVKKCKNLRCVSRNDCGSQARIA